MGQTCPNYWGRTTDKFSAEHQICLAAWSLNDRPGRLWLTVPALPVFGSRMKGQN